MSYLPENDGIDHINLYTKGQTRLGRLLTNLADIAVDHPDYGRFRTAEGLWYYLKTGKCHEELRAMTGFEVKRYGRTLPVVWNREFQDEFKEGLRRKIMDHEQLFELFVNSTLPFAHYYVYGTNAPKVVTPKDGQWLVDYLTELRHCLR